MAGKAKANDAGDVSGKLVGRLVKSLTAGDYSPRTAQMYAHWTRRYLAATRKTAPEKLTDRHIRDFIARLCAGRSLSPSTQRQALNALVYLHANVLGKTVEHMAGVVVPRNKRPRLSYLTEDEIGRLLAKLDGPQALMGNLMVRCGAKLMECVQLRVRDFDLRRGQIRIRDRKDAVDRVVPLPSAVADAVATFLAAERKRHADSVAEGAGRTRLPADIKEQGEAVERRWDLQYAFTRVNAPRGMSGRFQPFREHYHPSSLQKGVKAAATAAGIRHNVNCHSLRHTCALGALKAGLDAELVRQRMGLADRVSLGVYERAMQSEVAAAKTKAGPKGKAAAATQATKRVAGRQAGKGARG